MTNLANRSISQLGSLLRSGELLPTQLVEDCLARIDKHEARVKAWVKVDREGARQAAQERESELKRGVDRGPLHGIPVGIKDIIDVQGWPTLAGSPLRAGHVASQNAPLVDQLIEAGAVILGKTVTTEFAWIDPPVTTNPWNQDRTPGGSSSGSAAAVAAGMCPLCIGSQTGGSIVRPASFCGVAGLKPTHKGISDQGFVPISGRLDHPGPIARYVDDLRIAFGAIRDAVKYPAERDLQSSPGIGLSHLRLGFVEEFFTKDASVEVASVVRMAVEKLRQQGAVIEVVPLPESFQRVHANHRTIMACDAAQYHLPNFRVAAEKFSKNIRLLVEEGLAKSEREYAAAVEHQLAFSAELDKFVSAYDALIMPATNRTAPTRETTGDPRFQSPWSYAGVPVVSVPSGLAADGLPVAVQLVGKKWSDDHLLNVAACCESVFGFTDTPD